MDTMSPGDNEVIEYDAGIRYDYYGTANGGTNRVHDDFDGDPALGSPIPDKTRLTNRVDLDAEYQGDDLPTQSAQASVTAAYATVNKSGSISRGGNGSVINYTLTYLASEYYDILDDDADSDDSSITLHDLLPDGQTYNDDASPAESSFIANGDGTTDIYWNSSVLGALGHSGSLSVTFSATVDTNWGDSNPIVGGDSMSNTVDAHGTWDDRIDVSRADGTTDSSASAGFSMATPHITKEVENPASPGAWLESVDATVGDTLRFRVRFNTNDGANPEITNVNLGDIVVTDWLPPGTSYNDDAVVTYSDNGDFSGSNFDDDPNVVAIGGLNGVEWELGDVRQGGWWQAVFTAEIVDNASVAEGKKVNNIWKMTGINTPGAAYSDRDNVEISYHEPHLVLTKTPTTVPSPLLPGSVVAYTVSISNTGNAAARNMLFTDTLAAQMRAVAPTITSISVDGSTLTAGTDYILNPAYNGTTGVWSVDFSNGPVATEIPAGKSMAIVYNSTVNAAAGMGASLTNIATVGYGTQHDGAGRNVSGTSAVPDDQTDDANVTLPQPSIDKTAAAGPYRIGSTIPYSIRVTVGAGQMLHWPDIRDQFNRDGVSYISGSTALSDVSGTPPVPASFDSSSDPTITTSTANQTSLRWNLREPIDNRAQATPYVFDLRYSVRYTGLRDDGSSWEYFIPTSSDRMRNTARLYWADNPAASRTTNRNVSDLVDVDIDQPLLSTDKIVTSAGPYVAGSTIAYRVVVTNVGWSTAYDITWEDDISAYAGNAVLTSVTHSATGALVSGVHYQENLAADPLTIDFDGGTTDTNLAPGASITIVYTTRMRDDIGAGATVGNVADVDWSSMDDVSTGERLCNDASQENAYTNDTDNAQVAISQASFEKSIVTPVSGNARIGETVMYKLRVTVPTETVLYDPRITDVVDADGMRYVDGSVSVSAPVTGSPAAAATITSSPTIDTASPNPGQTMTFVFDNDIDNADPGSPTGDTAYVFEVTYRMLVVGVSDGGGWVWDPAVTGHDVANTATLLWSDGSNDHMMQDDALLRIIQPRLAVEKDIAQSTVTGGGPITATITITNRGDGTSYEHDGGSDLTDTFPPGLVNPVITSVEHSENGVLDAPADYVFSDTGSGFTLEYESARTDLAPGESLTITYGAQADPLVGAGATLTNAADADYSSMSGEQADERVYDDSNPLEGDVDRDQDTVLTPSPTITKTTTLDDDTITIGEEFDYLVTVDVPEGTTLYNALIGDTLVDGLTVTGVDVSPSIGDVDYSENAFGEWEVLWDAGDASNSPVGQLIMTVHVRVDDTYVGDLSLDGMPVSIDGDAQDEIPNTALIEWDDADSAGTTHSQDDDVDLTIVEPYPSIRKEVNGNVAGIGDVMTYTVTIANDGLSPLYDIVFVDALPEELFESGVSPSITSVDHSTRGSLSDGTDYTTVFGADDFELHFSGASNHTNLDFGESIVIVYEVRVENTVEDGDILQNRAEFSGYSYEGDYGRVYGDRDEEAITIASTSIGDTVWHDSDRDGVQDVGESGIAGVDVSLRNGSGDPLDDPLHPGTPYTVVTDADGGYLFANLTAGEYRVHFDPSAGYGVTTKNQGGDDTTDSDADEISHMTNTITLAHDAHITHVDAGFITTKIGGSVWVDADGDGLYVEGEAMQSGVTVHLLDADGQAVDDPLHPGMPYVVTTDVQGDYVFENLLANRYVVRFDVPTGNAVTVKDRGSDDAIDSDADTTTGRTDVIVLVAGNDSFANDMGVYLPSSIGDLVWHDRDADGIRDEGEEGLSGVSVHLHDMADARIATSVTDADGRYLFENLAPGSYRVYGDRPSGYHLAVQDVGSDDEFDSDLNPETSVSDTLTIPSGSNRTDVDAGMYMYARIGDRVWRDDERNGIQESWEPGLAGVTVELLDVDGDPVDDPTRSGTPYTVVTDADGAYVFTNVIPGEYRVRFVQPTDHAPAALDQGSDDARDSDMDGTTLTTQPFVVSSGNERRTTDAGFHALYANVFDPPSAIKTVGETGDNEIEWTMVWINDGNMTAVDVQVLDDVPTGTSYVSDSVTCDARGASATDVCVYDEVENRIRWEGAIASDPGGTTEENSLHEVVIRYRTTVSAEMDTVENQASAYWDANGDGSFEDDVTRGQVAQRSNDPDTSAERDPTMWRRVQAAEGNSSIGNYIWHDKNGDGKQDLDEPGLKDIRVKLVWAGPDGRFDTDDDHVWRTDTNHNGRYLFEDLPKGKYRVYVKEEDVKGWIQTYDPTGEMNYRASVRLGSNDHHTKADFGFNMTETRLAKTGGNMLPWIGATLGCIIGLGLRAQARRRFFIRL